MLSKSAGFAIVLKGKPGREEQILLTHPTKAPWARTYSIVKGGLEPGESQLDAAIREFKEETGHELSQHLIDRVKGRTPDIVVQNATKVLSAWVIFISDPKEIGMETNFYAGKEHIIYPKEQLQAAEIDWAGFVSIVGEAKMRIAPYQVPILDEIKAIRMADEWKDSPYYKYYSGSTELKPQPQDGSFKWAAPSKEFGKVNMGLFEIKFQPPFVSDIQKMFTDYFISKLKDAAKRVVIINDHKLAVMNGDKLIEITVPSPEYKNFLQGDNVVVTISIADGANIATKEFSREKETAESFTQNIINYILEVEKNKQMDQPSTPVENNATPGACKTSTDLTKIVTDSGGTVPYVPISNVCETNMGTVVPRGMYSEMINALKIVQSKIQEKYGFDLSDFVLNRLQYSPEELGIDPAKYKKANDADKRMMMRNGLCGAMSDEQIDAVALAIFNIEREDATGKGFGMIIGDMTGIGKGRSQPLDAKVLTPKGWVEMGSLKVGSQVMSVDGQPTDVIGIYPQGKIDVYEVVFSDGSKTECSADHLWTVKSKQSKYHGKSNPDSIYGQYKVFETKELMKPKRIKMQYSIPLVSAIDFKYKEVDIDPYLLGVLLGDACLRKQGVELTCNDEQILSAVNALLPDNLSARKIRHQHYQLSKGRTGFANVLVQRLRALGLTGKVANNKFIPECYKINSPAVRLAILQGLMDTDGYVNAKGSCMYYTVSNQLASDIEFIVRSLGGTTTRGIKKTYRQDCHIVYIKMPNGVNPFRLLRKANRVKDYIKYSPQRIIRSITLIGKKECQCIKVSHPTSLYVTDDFIVTHNTAAALIRYCIKFYNRAPIFITEKGYLFSDIYRDIADIKSDPVIPLEYKIGERQVKVKLTKSAMINEVKLRMEEFGESKEEAEEYINNVADRGYVVESEYLVNAKYPLKLDIDKLIKDNADAKVSEVVRRAMHKGEGASFGKQYLKIKPLIINARKDETKIKDMDGNIVYEPLADTQLRSILTTKKLPKEYNLIMLTYSQINKAGITLKKEFIQKMAEGTLVICDESHNASGQSNVGEYIYDLLSSAKGAVFLSATYSKRPDNMVVYAAKTSIREADLSKEELINAVASGGVPLQEIISSQLVAEGQMVRRERTYAGVDVLWNTLDSSMAKTGHPEFDLKDKHSVIANMFTAILRDVIRFQTTMIKPLLKDPKFLKEVIQLNFGETAQVPRGKDVEGMLTSSPIFSRVFNVVNQLLFSIKAEAIADRAINYMKAGKKPVIAFANTMGTFLENMTNEDGTPLQSGDEINTDFKLVLQRLLDNAMSITVKDPMDPTKSRKMQISRSLLPAGESFEYGMVQQKINTISIGISISPIDVIIYKIKAAGFTVEEVTGRASVVNFYDTTFMKGTYQVRNKKAKTDIFRAFNENKTDCLLINQSGSTGASIQAKENKVVTHVAVKLADGTIVNTEYKRGMVGNIVVPTSLEPRNQVKQRVMLMLQAELNINTEVQKMGRIFRSGQLLPPMFEYLASAIPAEKRLQMIMQKKLHSLYANTSANQKASDELVSVVDFINKYGNRVVCEYLLSKSGLITKLGDPAGMIDSKSGNISMPAPIPDDAAHKTTGRIAILEIGEQEDFYNKVSQKYKDYIRFLDEQDEYTGEVKYVDLQAVTLDKRIFKVGSNIGTSLFSKNTILELCEVNNLRKPYTREEVEEFLKESLGDYTAFGSNYRAAKRQQMDLLAELERDFKYKVEYNNEKYEQAAASAVEMILVDTRYLNLLKKDPPKAEEYKRINEEAIPKEYEERKKRKLDTLNSDHAIVKNYLAKIYNGMVTNYVKGDIKVPAVVLNIGIDRAERNPFTPSNIIIKVAVANGLRVLNVPLSQSEFIDKIIAEELRDSYDAEQIIGSWDRVVKAAAKDRLQRYILTGNILQIMSDPIVLENVGQLIKFTQCINGKVFLRNGVRLAESFDPAKMSGGRGSSFVMVSAKKCLPILENLVYRVTVNKEKIQARRSLLLGDREFKSYYENDTAEWVGAPADIQEVEERAQRMGLKKKQAANDQSHYTTSNDVKFSRARNGIDFFIEVPTYYKQFVVDPVILDFVGEEKGFSSSGSMLVDQKQKNKESERGKTPAKVDVNAMGATIEDDKMQAFLDYISFKYKASFKISSAIFDEFKDQMGVSDNMDADNMVSVEESESGLAQADMKTMDPVNNAVLEEVQDPVSEHAEQLEAIGSIAETEEVEQPTAQIDKALDEQAKILAEREVFNYEKKLFQLYMMLSTANHKPAQMATGGPYESVSEVMDSHGFDEESTGGGFFAYTKTLDNGNYVMITTESGNFLPKKLSDKVTLTVYKDSDDLASAPLFITDGNIDQVIKEWQASNKKADGGKVSEPAVTDDDKARWREIAETILSQLGGQRRLVMMTGAHTFLIHRNGLSFKFANMGQEVNYVKIILNGNDYYDVTLGRIWGDTYKIIHEDTDIDAENLVDYIQTNSGLALHL